MIRHVSLLTFAESTSAAHVDAITAALRRLPAVIPELRDYRVGADLGVDEGNASFVVIGDFDDEAGYRAVSRPSRARRGRPRAHPPRAGGTNGRPVRAVSPPRCRIPAAPTLSP